MKKILFYFVLAASSNLWGAVEYSIVNLDTLGLASRPDCDSTVGIGLNRVGQAVVAAELIPDAVFVYTDEAGLESLGMAGLGGLIPYGINDSGQVVAYGTQLFRYTPGQGWQGFNAPGDGAGVNRGINSSGQMIGTATNEVAYRYTDGIGFQYLNSLHGGPSYAVAINREGSVTGMAESEAWGEGTIFLYKDGVEMIYLGEGIGTAINDQGVIAAYTPSVGAVLCTGGQFLPLGINAAPNAINNRNEIVGMGAYVWSSSQGLRNLNSLVPSNSGWGLTWAYDINDIGQIVGYGTYQGNTVAYRLDPLPRLSIHAAGTNVVVSWQPDWPDAVLQATTSLSNTDWQTVPTGGTNRVSLPAAAPDSSAWSDPEAREGATCLSLTPT